jgi:hypothetical protein
MGAWVFWGAHAPSPARDGTLAIANFSGMREALQFEDPRGFAARAR